MNSKETYQFLVQKIQNHHRIIGSKISKEIIAQKLGLSRTYFSALLGGSVEVKQYHIDDLKLKFKDILEGKDLPEKDQLPQSLSQSTDQTNTQTKQLLDIIKSQNEIIQNQNEIIQQQQQTINQLIAAQGNAKRAIAASG